MSALKNQNQKLNALNKVYFNGLKNKDIEHEEI